MSTVGKSHRTPFKHWVLDKTLGRIAGIMGRGYVPFIWGDFTVVDLCAGDGESGPDGDSSPSIIAKHCNWVANEFTKRGGRSKSKAVFIEKMANTHDKLKSNSHVWSGKHNTELMLGDARDYRVAAGEHDAVFVNADPNHIHDMPLAEGLIDSLPQFTTMTMTLGCNVGGLKMMKLSEREPWYQYVDMATGRMKSFHDAILCRIDRDKAQWAYLSVVPKKFAPSIMADMKKAGDRMFTHGVSLVSMRDSADEWTRMIDGLFKTREELQHAS